MEDTKICGRCQENKKFEEFNKSKRGRFGYHNHCRSCQKEVRRKWYLNNIETAKQKSSETSKSEKAKAYRRERWKRHKSTLSPINNARRRTEEARIKARKQREQWYSIPHNRISHNLRTRIRKAIKGYRYDQCESLLGCSFENLKLHIESKFIKGMTWNNYGEWHLDHIIPCSFFDLTKEEHQKICFHHLNLQPLWRSDNISKNNRILIEDVSSLIELIKSKLT